VQVDGHVALVPSQAYATQPGFPAKETGAVLQVPLTEADHPSVAPLHASQEFPQATLQQNPSTQKPVTHTRHPADLQSAPAEVLQGAAGTFWYTHCPAALQYEPVAQSASLPHVVGQVPDDPLHTYDPQPLPALPWGSVVHDPLAEAPSPAEHTSHPPVQAALPQKASEQLLLLHSAGPRQAWPFFLRHTPLALHVFVPVHVSPSSALVTLEHVPMLPALLQALQLVLQAESQQKKSAQERPVWHSRQPATAQSPPVDVLQAAPLAFRDWQVPPVAQK
jgi:hypothetical protein